MYRSRSSISYNILNEIHFPANISVMLAYLSYFPPPPPVLPGPPPRRSWTCSSSSLSFNDRNLPSLRYYNQTRSFKNTSQISITSSSSISNYFIDLFHQNQFSFILLSIFILCLILVISFSLILFTYFQRHRQRPITSNTKNKKFYYNLIPHRQKHRTTEQKLVRLRKDSSSTAQVIHPHGIHTKNNNETEEAV